MPHPTGEKLRCDDCGAEIVFTKACPCPEREPKAHSDLCCGKEMRSVGIEPRAEPAAKAAGAGH